MSRFVLIETATDACSVAIADERGLLCVRESLKAKAQASELAPLIDEVLKESETSIKECAGVSVSMGPGSYTGLRVGLSTAKGLCFGADIKLMGVGTLDILAQLGRGKAVGKVLIIPMIDARRMEVYTAMYDSAGNALSSPEAKILGSDSFEKEFGSYDTLVFIGDGVEKFRDILDEKKLSSSLFIPQRPSVHGMLVPTLRLFEKGEFEDIAYAEPLYLKEFIAGTSRKEQTILNGAALK